MKVTASLYPFKFIAVKVKAKKDGGGGFRKRLRAYELHNSINLSDVPFGIIHAALVKFWRYYEVPISNW